MLLDLKIEFLTKNQASLGRGSTEHHGLEAPERVEMEIFCLVYAGEESRRHPQACSPKMPSGFTVWVGLSVCTERLLSQVSNGVVRTVVWVGR